MKLHLSMGQTITCVGH